MEKRFETRAHASDCAERTGASPSQAEARQNGDAPPETAEQLEALVTAEPDSSMLWIRYVAYLLSTGDVGAARAVAERALKTINYRHAPSFAGCLLVHKHSKAQEGANSRRATCTAP